jgi:phytoene synthase
MGLAMQMTNFLRDVGEDWARGRVYLPQDELQRFGVSEAQIANGIVDDRWVAMMRFQIDRCRALYAEAEQGIPLLPREAQYPVLLGGTALRAYPERDRAQRVRCVSPTRPHHAR